MVDSRDQFGKIFKKYYGLLSDKSMITAVRVVDNSAKIAKAKPDPQKRITAKLLKVEKIPRGQKCKDIHPQTELILRCEMLREG